MKTIKIPENIQDLKDYIIFINAAKELNAFNKNVQKYCEKIVKTEFLKKVKDWKEIASEKHLKLLNEYDDYDELFFDYKNNVFLLNWTGYIKGLTMCDTINHQTKFSLSDDGQIIYVENTWQYKKSRFSHSPVFSDSRIYEINLIEKSIKKL